MQEDRAPAIAVELDTRGVNCQLERDAGFRYHLRVALQHDRAALWHLHGDLLEARVLRAGAPVGLVSPLVQPDVSDRTLAELVATERDEQFSAALGRSGSLADPDSAGAAVATKRADAMSGRLWLLLGMLAVVLVLFLLDGGT